MKALAIGMALAGGLMAVGAAQAADLGTGRGGYGHLSCGEIAQRIQADNGPIGDENSTWKQLQRNPTPQFFLLGIKSPDPEHDAYVDGLRQDRRELIAAAVARNCAGR